jgi:hypothetical protein
MVNILCTGHLLMMVLIFHGNIYNGLILHHATHKSELDVIANPNKQVGYALCLFLSGEILCPIYMFMPVIIRPF